jgi:pilus assembly protein CpaC
VLLANVVNSHGVSINALLSALEEKGLVKSLAEPDLVALSGEKATFLAGGEIPIPVVQGTNATNGTLGVGVNYTPNVSIEWKQFGVGLDFTPTVLNNGIINLQLNPSVTEVNTANSLNINGTTVPSLIERKAHTAVELRDGQSFAIAGLLQAQSSAASTSCRGSAMCRSSARSFAPPTSRRTRRILSSSSRRISSGRWVRGSIWRRRSTLRFRPTTSTCS